MMIIPAKFQPSSFTGMAGKRGDGCVTPSHFPAIPIQKNGSNHNDFSKHPPSHCLGGIKKTTEDKFKLWN